MRRLRTAALTLALPLGAAFAQEPTTEDPFYFEAEKLGWDLTERHRVPGVGIARLGPEGIAWALGCGYADPETEEPIVPETVFSIGSISKTVAAWGVMRLVERGELDLDAPVSTYLTRWKLPASEFDLDQVTLRRLLSHTAGLSLHGYPGYLDRDEVPTIEESLDGESNAGELVMLHAPGTLWKYSGGGYTISQLIVEEVTGRDFAEYMHAEVLEPLGMHSSDYTWTERVRANAAVPYQDGAPLVPGGNGPHFVALAAAGLQTSVLDLARFGVHSMAREDAADAQHVLSPQTIALMQQPVQASPDYGLGYQIDERDGVRLVGHGGANQGWMAQLWVAPELRDGIVILTNSTDGQRVIRPLVDAWRATLAKPESDASGD